MTISLKARIACRLSPTDAGHGSKCERFTSTEFVDRIISFGAACFWRADAHFSVKNRNIITIVMPTALRKIVNIFRFNINMFINSNSISLYVTNVKVIFAYNNLQSIRGGRGSCWEQWYIKNNWNSTVWRAARAKQTCVACLVCKTQLISKINTRFFSFHFVLNFFILNIILIPAWITIINKQIFVKIFTLILWFLSAYISTY